MKTCKDCIHYDLCVSLAKIEIEFGPDKRTRLKTGVQDKCHYFKDKSLVLDLPCKVGDTVYVIFSQFKTEINKCRVDEFLIGERGIFAVLDVHYHNYIARRKTSIPISWFNRFAFSTKEAAEQALKGR